MGISKKHLFWLLLICILFVIHALFLSCVAEDAYISFRYAENLIQGHGLVWNVGEPPVEGYTNFLWVILSALALVLGLPVPVFTQAVGIVSGIAIVFLTYLYARRLLNLADYSLIPCLFLAVSGPFATWAASGMETNFFALCILTGCYFFARFWQGRHYRYLYVTAIALLIATLTRPEGFLIAAVLGILHLRFLYKSQENICKASLLSLFIYLVPFLIYFTWRFSYFGYPLPNTFYAKTGGGIYQYLRGGIYLGYFSAYFIFPLLLPVFLWWWEKGTSFKSPAPMGNDTKPNIGMMSCLTLCVIYTMYIIFVGGDYMAMFRFFVPILPLIYLCFGSVFRTLYYSPSMTTKRRALVHVLLIFAVTATIFQSTPAEKIILHPPLFQHGQYQGVMTERWHSTRLSLIGQFFHDYKRDNDESLATDAIGAIGYFSGMKIYDIYGIVDPEIAHLSESNKPLGWGLPAHEKTNDAYIFSKTPTYYMFSRDLTEEPVSIPDFADPDLQRYISDNYKLSSVWLEDTKNQEAGYFCFLELQRD